jgi:glycosyltransferase involved in cell wall biosynthesis
MISPYLYVITRQSPFPGGGGSGEYFFDVLSYLAENGVSIDCLWIPISLNEKNGLIILSRKFDRSIRLKAIGYFRLGRILFNPRLFFASAGKAIAGLFNRPAAAAPCIWNCPATPSEMESIKAHLVGVSPDAVMVNYFWMTPAFQALPAANRSLKIVLTHEVWHRKVADFKERGIPTIYSEVTPDDEAGLLSKAEVIVAISKEDAAELRTLAPKREVLTASKAVRFKTVAGLAEKGRCLFVGSGYAANVDGLKWFLAEIWPLILNRAPAAHLHVCGTVSAKIEGRFPNVTLLGRLKNLEREYKEAEVVVIPLRVGAGIKIKTVEALGFGKAIVTTSYGRQGLDFLNADHLLIADDPQNFAAGVVKLLEKQGLRKNLETKARLAAQQHLSPGACYRPLLEELLRACGSNLSKQP